MFSGEEGGICYLIQLCCAVPAEHTKKQTLQKKEKNILPYLLRERKLDLYLVGNLSFNDCGNRAEERRTCNRTKGVV